MKTKQLTNIIKLMYIILCFSIQNFTYAQTQKGGDIDGETSYDYSGRSVSMPDANTVAIGAVGNGGGGKNAGHVRVYDLFNENTGILENSFGNYLKAFPNPTQGEVKIALGVNYNDVSVIVRNSVGKEVMRKSCNNTNLLEICIPGEAGIYCVEVSALDKKALLNLIKE